MSQKCRIEGCNRTCARRGLCLICYGVAKKKVEAGEVTWEKLVELGLCEPDKDPFDSAYERATKSQS